MITYSLIVFAGIIFLNYSGIDIKFLRIGHHRYLQFAEAIVVGIVLGTIEYLILGSTPLIQTLIVEDAVFIIYIVFMIGLGEELIYRGLLQQIQEGLIGRKAALFLSSVLFGIMHLIWRNPLEFFFTTFAGFIFGLQFNRTNSIWVPTLSHALNNYTWLLIWPILTGITHLTLPI
jgi:membrane protease YdiL (CAAX protease family)